MMLPGRWAVMMSFRGIDSLQEVDNGYSALSKVFVIKMNRQAQHGAVFLGTSWSLCHDPDRSLGVRRNYDRLRILHLPTSRSTQFN